MNRCKSCKHFARGGYFKHTVNVFSPEYGRDLVTDPAEMFGICLNEKIDTRSISDWMLRKQSATKPSDSAFIDEERVWLQVGEDFGCIHHEEGIPPIKMHFDPIAP